MHTHRDTCANTQAHTNKHALPWIHTWTRKDTHMGTHALTWMHACTHLHGHTPRHTCKHTLAQFVSDSTWTCETPPNHQRLTRGLDVSMTSLAPADLGATSLFSRFSLDKWGCRWGRTICHVWQRRPCRCCDSPSISVDSWVFNDHNTCFIHRWSKDMC